MGSAAHPWATTVMDLQCAEAVAASVVLVDPLIMEVGVSPHFMVPHVAWAALVA